MSRPPNISAQESTHKRYLHPSSVPTHQSPVLLMSRDATTSCFHLWIFNSFFSRLFEFLHNIVATDILKRLPFFKDLLAPSSTARSTVLAHTHRLFGLATHVLCVCYLRVVLASRYGQNMNCTWILNTNHLLKCRFVFLNIFYIQIVQIFLAVLAMPIFYGTQRRKVLNIYLLGCWK